MRVPFAASFISNYFLTFWLFIIWGVLAFWLLLKRGGLGLLGFSLLYPWLMFFTEFSTVRIQEVFVLYRSYLWMPGLFFIPLIVSKYVKMRIIVIVGVAVSVLFFILSMERLITMSHPLLLWNDAEKLVNGRPEVPGAARIYYNRGSEFVHAGEFELAEADLKYALKLSPNYVEAQVNLGATYFKRKEWQAAIESFDLANKMYERKGLNLQPFFIHQRGQAFEFLGLISDAKRDFAESCRLAKLGCERID
jgi:tetratricopeptide (TPR) repeat protein